MAVGNGFLGGGGEGEGGGRAICNWRLRSVKGHYCTVAMYVFLPSIVTMKIAKLKHRGRYRLMSLRKFKFPKLQKHHAGYYENTLYNEKSMTNFLPQSKNISKSLIFCLIWGPKSIQITAFLTLPWYQFLQYMKNGHGLQWNVDTAWRNLENNALSSLHLLLRNRLGDPALLPA